MAIGIFNATQQGAHALKFECCPNYVNSACTCTKQADGVTPVTPHPVHTFGATLPDPAWNPASPPSKPDGTPAMVAATWAALTPAQKWAFTCSLEARMLVWAANQSQAPAQLASLVGATL